MRFIVAFCAVLAVCHSTDLQLDDRSARVFENEIKKAVECIKTNLQQGIPELELPPFDPLNINDVTLNLDNLDSSALTGQLTLQNFHLRGITNWGFDNLKGSVGIIPPGYTLKFTVSDPKIEMDGDYDMNIVINGKNIFGKGHITLTITNEHNTGNMKITVLGGIKLKDFNVEIGIDSSELKLTGYMNDEELSAKISDEVTNNLASILEEHKAEISATIKKLLMDIINKKLELKDAKEIDLVAIVKELVNRCVKV